MTAVYDFVKLANKTHFWLRREGNFSWRQSSPVDPFLEVKKWCPKAKNIRVGLIREDRCPSPGPSLIDDFGPGAGAYVVVD
jgi:hypothetical protein